MAGDAAKTIPIVCPLLTDPVRLGLIKSDARPGGNVTGLLAFVEGMAGKQLELVLDLIPRAAKIGLVVNAENIYDLSQRRELEIVAAAKAIKVVSVEVRRPEDVDPIFPTLAKERVDARKPPPSSASPNQARGNILRSCSARPGRNGNWT